MRVWIFFKSLDVSSVIFIFFFGTVGFNSLFFEWLLTLNTGIPILWAYYILLNNRLLHVCFQHRPPFN